MVALRHYYRDLGATLWDIYGPRDAYNPGAVGSRRFVWGSIRRPIVVMVENNRTGLLPFAERAIY